MKKLAITVTAALLMGGLSGCGDVENQARENGNNNYRNLTVEQRGADVTGARYTGEGPITDMMTREERGGAGFGAAGTRENRGLFGNRADVDADRGQMGVRGNRAPNGVNRGHIGLHDGPQMDGGFATRNDRTPTIDPHMERGITGLDMARDPRVEARGIGADRPGLGEGMNGFVGGTRELNRDFRADDNVIGAQRPGMGRSGVVGDRPGMVGKDGFLNDRAEAGHRGTAIQQGMQTRPGARMQQRTQQDGTALRYHRDYDAQTVQKIRTRVAEIDNVKDARIIVHDDTVVVGVEATGRDYDRVKTDIDTQVRGLANGKKVHVVTDQDAVTRIRTMDDRLRAGAAFEEIGATFTEMVRDLGRAAGRPFEQTRS